MKNSLGNRNQLLLRYLLQVRVALMGGVTAVVKGRYLGYFKCIHAVATCPFIVNKVCFHHSFSETAQREVRYHRVNLSGRNCLENKVTQDWSCCNELEVVANT